MSYERYKFWYRNQERCRPYPEHMYCCLGRKGFSAENSLAIRKVVELGIFSLWNQL